MTVQHLQRLHEQQKQQQQQCLKEQVAALETGERASPKLQEKKQTKKWPESYTSTDKSQAKPEFDHQEKCNPFQQYRPSSTVPDTMYRFEKQSKQVTATTVQRNVSSCVQKRYYEGSSSPKFRAGFSECAREAREILNHFEDVDPAVCQRLSNHLASCLDSLENRHDVTSTCSNRQAADSTQNTMAEEARLTSSSSPSLLIQTPTGLTLLPTKLPNGDLAFVIPADIKNSVTSCLKNESAQNTLSNSEIQCVEESKHLQEAVVWRPW
jgi:hypothetical protein